MVVLTLGIFNMFECTGRYEIERRKVDKRNRDNNDELAQGLHHNLVWYTVSEPVERHEVNLRGKRWVPGTDPKSGPFRGLASDGYSGVRLYELTDGVQTVDVYAKPLAKGKVIGYVHAGDKLACLSTNGIDWLKVKSKKAWETDLLHAWVPVRDFATKQLVVQPCNPELFGGHAKTTSPAHI